MYAIRSYYAAYDRPLSPGGFDLVHCNDWQTALVPALLRQELARPATLFTIHNLAYQGLFSRAEFDKLQLPPARNNFV